MKFMFLTKLVRVVWNPER